jgi:predicted transposase/invertase (TIGR01784 family)
MRETLHDKGYKRLFSNPQLFRELIETFVTEEWVKDIDFTDCQKIDKSFVSAHYKETESDIIYKVKFKNKNAYIYLLLEFQSTIAWYMALRMLNYVSNFYMDYVEARKKVRKLPPLFPLVLYNGNKKWTAATDFKDLLEQPDLLRHYAPQMHYFKIAENEYDSETLLKISNLVSMLFLAENNENTQIIAQQLLLLFDKQEDKQAISILLNWFEQLALRGKKSLDDCQLLEHVYYSKEEVKTMIDANLEPYAQSFFVKGKEEGLQVGIQKGIQKGKFETVILLLESRFGELTVEQKEKVYLLSEKNINQFLKQIWTTQSLQDFFKFVE